VGAATCGGIPSIPAASDLSLETELSTGSLNLDQSGIPAVDQDDAMVRSIAVLVFLAPMAAVAQDIARGKALADRWCGNCHLIDRAATGGAADGLPTFPAIAAKPTTTESSLRGFMTAAHGRMPDFSLGRADQNDLIGYILSLREK
jgi:mono/diheme cytochrome c family protein